MKRVSAKAFLLGLGLLLSSAAVLALDSAFISRLGHIEVVASTISANGDVNPYGVAIVPRTTGKLVQGDILVSNFNNVGNLQGTGTTIVQISPNGMTTLFAHIDPHTLPGPCPGGVGLTTALAVMRSGWVIVGSLPTSDGTAQTAQAGCLIVLNRLGQAVETFTGSEINGPWDMTSLAFDDKAILFVTNVLNGTVAANGQTVQGGTVLRMVVSFPDQDNSGDVPRELVRTIIASGFTERTDPAALVIGPTGVGLGRDGTLYVADTLANRIAAIPFAVIRASSAGIGRTVSQGAALNGPLGLAIGPGGNIVATNSSDGNMVEVTPTGRQVGGRAADITGTGAGTLSAATWRQPLVAS